MKRSIAVLWVLSGFLTGILLGELGLGVWAVIFFVIGLGGFYFIFIHSKNWGKVLMLFVVGLLVGYLRFILLAPHFGVENIASYTGVKIDFMAMVADEPDVRPDYQNLVLAGQKILYPREILVSGKVLVKLPKFPPYQYGDVVKVECNLEVPPRFEKFNYADYLERFDIFALCRNPRLFKSDAENQGNWFWRGVFGFKAICVAKIEQLWREPDAAIVSGLLFGLRRTIPQKILDDFNTAGLTHILAISGFNVTLLINVFASLFKGAARRIRFVAMCSGIFLLLLFTGFSASVVRAAIMGFLVLIAQQLGRKSSGLIVLLLSGAAMIAVNPKMLLSDLSFQLSFLSTLGLILVMPFLEKLKLPLPDFFREGFLVTIAAMVFTTPLLLFQFGRFSIIAPIANIFVLPLVAPIMFFAFVALVLSFLAWPLAQLAAYITFFLINLMLGLAGFFAGLPFASLHF